MERRLQRRPDYLAHGQDQRIDTVRDQLAPRSLGDVPSEGLDTLVHSRLAASLGPTALCLHARVLVPLGRDPHALRRRGQRSGVAPRPDRQRASHPSRSRRRAERGRSVPASVRERPGSAGASHPELLRTFSWPSMRQDNRHAPRDRSRTGSRSGCAPNHLADYRTQFREHRVRRPGLRAAPRPGDRLYVGGRSARPRPPAVIWSRHDGSR